MPALIFGILVLVLGLWALNIISKVDPKVGARVTKAGGGILAIAAAAFIGLRGEIGLAIPLGAFGLGLLGWLPFGPAGFASRTKRSASQVSRVRTAFLEMELDHDNGKMRGRVTAGRHQGAMLDQLDVTTLSDVLHEIDEESRALLMAYLDRSHPRWREHAQADPGTGGAAVSGGKMSEKEAYQILGLEAGATKDAITRAHRALMKKFHPDQGGTSYLAARINEAKEVLFRRHR